MLTQLHVCGFGLAELASGYKLAMTEMSIKMMCNEISIWAVG